MMVSVKIALVRWKVSVDMDRLISENMAWHYTKLAMPISERAKLKEAFEMVPDVDVQLEVSKRLESKIRVEAYKALYDRIISDINDLCCWTDDNVLVVSKEQVIETINSIMKDITLKGE